MRFAAVAATPLALTGCGTPLSTLDPAGPAASNIATLWWVMFWGACVLFLLVLGLLSVSLLRPAMLAAVKPMHWIIGGGLMMPIPILVGLLIAALVLGEQLLPRAGGAKAMRVEAHASQWQWRFTYPEIAGSAESDVLHLPAGEPVDIVVTTADVIHSFWIPRLGGKIDAIPGRENTIRLQADKPGAYHGICAEYCGPGHETMSFVAQAHDGADFPAAVGGRP
ncbi:cytochrome C oxidase subunit II [Devosia limi DSM 17137]|uniref:Cytochrome aa3 subunit 2 n=1 Tax=Devosia limi DSM 17137 TaxID=1121477 RepID=A0A0F5LNE7_9HYPH|nr:cytochrome C oxidase subunit II [Devosia limi DSM 17137]